MPMPSLYSINILNIAIENLEDIANEIMFVGGAVVPWLFTEESSGYRVTRDADCVIDIEGLADYYKFIDKLKATGFTENQLLNDNGEDNIPICRWYKGDCIIDIMPTTPVLGFTNRWYAPAFQNKQRCYISGKQINLISPVYFIATKIEAFNGRGNNDFMASHDIEDIISLFEKRAELVSEIQSSEREVKSFIVTIFKEWAARPRFFNDIIGHCDPDNNNQIIVINRIKEIIVNSNSLAI